MSTRWSQDSQYCLRLVLPPSYICMYLTTDRGRHLDRVTTCPYALTRNDRVTSSAPPAFSEARRADGTLGFTVNPPARVYVGAGGWRPVAAGGPPPGHRPGAEADDGERLRRSASSSVTPLLPPPPEGFPPLPRHARPCTCRHHHPVERVLPLRNVGRRGGGIRHWHLFRSSSRGNCRWLHFDCFREVASWRRPTPFNNLGGEVSVSYYQSPDDPRSD